MQQNRTISPSKAETTDESQVYSLNKVYSVNLDTLLVFADKSCPLKINAVLTQAIVSIYYPYFNTKSLASCCFKN